MPATGVPFSEGSVRGLAQEAGEEVAGLDSVPLEAAEQGMGPMARVLTTTSRLNATKARATFGWAPAPRSLVDDVRSGSSAQTAAR